MNDIIAVKDEEKGCVNIIFSQGSMEIAVHPHTAMCIAEGLIKAARELMEDDDDDDEENNSGGNGSGLSRIRSRR